MLLFYLKIQQSDMISVAGLEHIPAILSIVNKAYRGEDSKKGWTTEALLIEGDKRTDEKDIEELINNENSWILKYTLDNKIVANVNLQKQGDALYLGMFSVDPEMQGMGIGKKILLAADEFAKEKGCKKITMSVISVREELIAWYIKNGYAHTGLEKPFPTENKFGRPVMPLKFIILEKQIT